MLAITTPPPSGAITSPNASSIAATPNRSTRRIASALACVGETGGVNELGNGSGGDCRLRKGMHRLRGPDVDVVCRHVVAVALQTRSQRLERFFIEIGHEQLASGFLPARDGLPHSADPDDDDHLLRHAQSPV